MAARRKIEEIVKTLAENNAEAWGRIELEETKIGRLDHKIEKLQIIKLVPGVDWLRPDGRSGDHGITLEEYTPFGVVGAVTPSTHSIPTLSGNIVNIVAAGNAVVFNAHPGAARCAADGRARLQRGDLSRNRHRKHRVHHREADAGFVQRAFAKTNTSACCCVTGGPAVVKAAMQTGKRAICAGPGNPPVLVDDTCCLKRAARAIIEGAAFDNNLLCIGEKEVFVLDNIAGQADAENVGERRGEIECRAIGTADQGGVHFQGRAGRRLRARQSSTRISSARTRPCWRRRRASMCRPAPSCCLPRPTRSIRSSMEEQMMPFLPIVRVKSVEEGIARSLEAEHNYKHTSIIHSHDVENMTAMARALDTTLVYQERPVHGRPGPGRRRLSELFHRHADRRRRDQSRARSPASAAA